MTPPWVVAETKKRSSHGNNKTVNIRAEELNLVVNIVNYLIQVFLFFNQNPFARYLQSSSISVVNLNDQAEGLMMTSPQQQLVDLGVRSEPQDPSHQDSVTRRKYLMFDI